jgi:hypothetical protein
MSEFKKLAPHFLLAAALVACLQPLYFFALGNLDRVISHDGTWQHIREAFNSGVLGGVHAGKQYINGGDRFTDCYSLGEGLQPGVGAVTRGIIAARPASERHACDDLREAATNPEGVNWNQYARYWHGYRLYSAPLASAFPIWALKLINLALLVGAATLFWIATKKLLGEAAFLLCAPVLFCSDFVRIWQVTPHTVSTSAILFGAAHFASAIRRKSPDQTLILLFATSGSLFNFVDFLVNPPWQPMLFAFFLVATGRRFPIALYCAGTWFAAYGVTWASKWLIVCVVDPTFNIKADVIGSAVFRIAGDNAKVLHFPLAATTRVALNALLSWGTIAFVPLLVFLRVRLVPTFQLAWPALIAVAWFELLSNHSQIHAFFVSRSMAAAAGIVLAAAALRTSDNPQDAVANDRWLNHREGSRVLAGERCTRESE